MITNIRVQQDILISLFDFSNLTATYFLVKKISLKVIERFVNEYMALSNNGNSSPVSQTGNPGSRPGNATMEIIIKNKYSRKFNEDIIEAALEKIKLDVDNIKKIYITPRVINFVTK